MTNGLDWIADRPRRGWLSRMLAPEANAQPATSAFVVGIVAAAAFIASLTTEWIEIGIPRNFGEGNTEQVGDVVTISSTGSSAEMLGLVYALTMIVLLAVTGAVVNRADLALRLRLATAGAAIGLVGVVAAVTQVLPAGFSGQFVGLRTMPELVVTYRLGLLFAVAAAILPAIAVWLAARPASRAARPLAVATAPVSVDHVSEPDVVAAAPPPSAWSMRAQEPLDLSVTPER